MVTKDLRRRNPVEQIIPVGVTINNTILVFKNKKWTNASKLSDNQKEKLKIIVADINPYNIDEGLKYLSEEDKIIFEDYVQETILELNK